MQFNQPFNNSFFNEQCYTYPAPFQFTNIIGEGDVTSQISPDGSLQFYFIPIFGRDRRFSYPYCFNFQAGNRTPWPVGPEAWLIRRISSPAIPSVIQEQLTNARDPFLKSYYASRGNVDVLPHNGYYQKFHNDNVTSTTDIQYFYPSLRRNNIKYSTSMQVDIPPKCHKSTQYESLSSCSSIPTNIKNLRTNKNTFVRHYTVDTTDSAMSIDDKTEKQPSYRQKKDISVSFKKHKKSKARSKRQLCNCDSNNKADKKTTTYSDRASACVDTDGRETQTVDTVSRSLSKTELSDVNTVTSSDSCCDVCDHCINDTKRHL